jgi:hypothetical protein
MIVGKGDIVNHNNVIKQINQSFTPLFEVKEGDIISYKIYHTGRNKQTIETEFSSYHEIQEVLKIMSEDSKPASVEISIMRHL